MIAVTDHEGCVLCIHLLDTAGEETIQAHLLQESRQLTWAIEDDSVKLGPVVGPPEGEVCEHLQDDDEGWRGGSGTGTYMHYLVWIPMARVAFMTWSHPVEK